MNATPTLEPLKLYIVYRPSDAPNPTGDIVEAVCFCVNDHGDLLFSAHDDKDTAYAAGHWLRVEHRPTQKEKRDER